MAHSIPHSHLRLVDELPRSVVERQIDLYGQIGFPQQPWPYAERLQSESYRFSTIDKIASALDSPFALGVYVGIYVGMMITVVLAYCWSVGLS